MTINLEIADDPTSKLHAAIYYLVQHLDTQLNRTKLVKLLFLADMDAKEELQRTITGTKYIYLLYGPYSDDITASREEMEGYEIKESLSSPGYGYSYTIGDMPRIDPVEILDEREIEILNRVMIEHGFKSLKEILNRVYNLDCMKNIDPLDILLE